MKNPTAILAEKTAVIKFLEPHPKTSRAIRRQRRAIPTTNPAQQLGLFASSAPTVALEPCPDWPGRIRLTVTQEDCRWVLCPPLWQIEADRVMARAATLGIGFDLDLNQGWPVESEAIHGLVESICEGGSRGS